MIGDDKMKGNNNILERNNALFNKYEALLKMIQQGEDSQFIYSFSCLHPYEKSEFFLLVDEEERLYMYHCLDSEEMAQILSNTESLRQDMSIIFKEMPNDFSREAILKMSDDDATYVLNLLDNDQRLEIFNSLPDQKAYELKNLMSYHHETAGSIMTTEYISISPTMTAGDALKHIKTRSGKVQTIYVVYVVNNDNELIGVLSLRNIINSDPTQRISDVMNSDVIKIESFIDQEEIAHVMRKYDFLAIPVVDNCNHLVGMITVDDIIDVIDKEANEDYLKMAALDHVSDAEGTVINRATKRLPWLILLTFLGMITATILSSFEDTLAKVSLLAAFIPIISGMSGNTGTQSLAVSVRGISTGEMKKKNKFKHALKESTSGLITGSVCGFILFLVILIIYSQPLLGLIVAISLTIAMTVGTTIGSLIPFLMTKIGIDPAVASGPFITTINDIVSMLVYFSLATTFISSLT